MKKTNMKTVTLAAALMLLLSMPFVGFAQEENRGLFGRGGSSADYDYNGGESLMKQGSPNVYGTITNDSFGDSPLGSGLAILITAGAGYAVVRRKRSRKNTMLLLACVALLGFTQCKKEQPLEPQDGQVRITLNVDNGGNSGSRVNVTGADVAFTSGDKILVAYDGKYVGTIEHNGTNFSGNITATPNGTKPLYFYFLGNKDAGTLTAGTTTSCTVNISDQTTELPVISMAPSKESFPSSGNTYTAKLHNKCSLMKVNVTSASTRTICITGMNNKVAVDFSKVNETGDGLTGDTDQGFSYSIDETDGGLIKMMGSASVERWIIVLPQAALAAGGEGTAYTNEETQRYNGSRPALDAISSNQYLNSGVSLNVSTEDNSTTVDLSKLVYDYCAKNSETLTGILSGDYKISIAAGAKVTLSNVNINGSGTWNSGSYAGISCLGGATIILADGTTNTVKGFNVDYPGIHVPSGNTLTIQGTGTLNASSNGYGAGIGGGYKGYNTIDCGNIIISGGTVTATGGGYAAGIDSGGNGCSCGTITISGGTVTATGGQYAAGIGSGFNGSSCGAITISGGTVEATGGNDGVYGNAGVGIGSSDFSSCGAITIQNTVTRVTATKGGSSATNSIGAGNSGTCGTVTIGNYLTLAISTTTNTNDTWTLTPYVAPAAPTGALAGKFSVSSTKQVYFSQGNLQYQASTGTWRFAEHQYDFIGGGNFLSESNTEWIDLYRWGTSGINYTGHATLYRPWEWAYYSQYFNPYGSLTTNLYDGEVENAGKADWGYNAISNGGNTQNSGWRTLKNNTTDNEWQYIFNSRTTANEINSTSNARYTQARINIDDWAVKGIILFPDGSIGDTPSGVTWGTINAAASSWTTGTTQCTTAGWAALEAAGCVFLPAAGKYDDSGVSQAEIEGYYWSSSYASDDNAYGMYFYSNGVNPQYSDARHYGLSVRLVKDAN